MSNALELILPIFSFNKSWMPVRNSRTGKPTMIRTPEYKSWISINEAKIIYGRLAPKKPIKQYVLTITLPKGVRVDTDNTVKAINDLLQRCKIILNDRYNEELHVVKRKLESLDDCIVMVEEYIEGVE